MKISKKTLTAIIVVAAVAICIGIAFAVFNNIFNRPNSGDGIYYSQQGDGKYLQFFDDKTFSYIYDSAKDISKKLENTNQADVLNKGTWEQRGNKIILKFDEDNSEIIFVKKDGYIYREDTVFRGKTSDAKLLKNKYLLEESKDKYTEVWFLIDGTMSYDSFWNGDKTSRWGTYVRVDDILIARYDDLPDIPHRFLVLDNGVSKDIYSKNQIK